MGLASFNRMRREQARKLEETQVKPRNIEDMTLKELQEYCKEKSYENYSKLKKEELLNFIEEIENATGEEGNTEEVNNSEEGE